MKKTKEIEISGKKIEIFELSPRVAFSSADAIMKTLSELTPQNAFDLATTLIPKVSSLTADEMLDTPFSDLEIINEAFWGLNSSFLRILRHLGILAALEHLIEQIQSGAVIEIGKSSENTSQS